MIKQPTSRTCFLCGRENAFGLKMSWYNDPENNQIIGTVVVPEQFNGYPGIVHGGIVASILDETAGRSVLLDGNFSDLFVTLKLEVSYRQPTPTGVSLTAIGKLVRRRNRTAQATGELRLPDGTVTAECTALLALPPDEIKQDWEAEKKHWRVDPDE
jgi:uncharacterized protein (TIGR00369 family)